METKEDTEKREIQIQMEAKHDDNSNEDTLDHISKLKQSVGLTWKNITYSVNDDNKKKTILSEISGYVEPGKVLCILGPVK